MNIKNIEKILSANFSKSKLPIAKTLFFQKLSLDLHKYYGGKLEIMPKVPIWDKNCFNFWYTPGISKISTEIRDNNLRSYDLTLRGNLVAIVSDSTRVLGDGNCTPPGGLGVMEGKSLLLKYLAGIDSIPLCIDSRDSKKRNSSTKIINFVKMVSPTFSVINLEDISQPNCYQVLEKLQNELDIPVWHDDAQGTACVVLAGLYNCLKLVKKRMDKVKIVLVGAGAAGSQIATYLLKAGAKGNQLYIFDIKGALHTGRDDLKNNKHYFKQWNLAKQTNPQKKENIQDVIEGADIIIGASAPNTIKPKWISKMAKKAIVFAIANPVPEIYPDIAKKAGAYIVATGRGDFPNQINNSLAFPGILRAVIKSRASKITDEMSLSASSAIAGLIKREDLSQENIVPDILHELLVPTIVKQVAKKAVEQAVANKNISIQKIYKQTILDIKNVQDYINSINPPPQKILEEALKWTLEKI